MVKRELFKCTEHISPGFDYVDPRAVWGTTQEESDLMVIAFAIDPAAEFRMNPEHEQKVRQDALRAVAKRVRDALVRYHRLKE